MTEIATLPDDTLARSRLRLKRVFLRTLVLSLTACALVAVIALLIGEFNQTTQKILLTLGALALHSGMAMACVESRDRQRWPTLSLVGLVAFGLNLAILLTAVWAGNLGDTLGRALLTTGTLLAAYAVAIPCADLFEKRQRRALTGAGLAVIALAFAMVLVCIWAENAESVVFAKATAIACIVSLALTHSALLVRIPGGPALVVLSRATLGAAWTLAAMASIFIVQEVSDELAWRIFGAVGVIAASGTLALVILAKLRKVQRVEQVQTSSVRIDLRCPRCEKHQTITAGAAACDACGLKFRLEIEEPRCAKCDYLLWNLPERRCPECGTNF